MTTESLTALATLAAAWTLSAPAVQDLPKAHPRPVVIIGGTLVDGSGAPARRNDAILIQDGRIRAMGLDAGRRAPRDARLIDASNKWIVPGLIDGAAYLWRTGGLDARPDLVPDSAGRSAEAILAGIRRAPSPYLRACLCAGVTSVLNVDGPEWTFDLRAGREDDSLSPRIATTGPALTARPQAGPPPDVRGNRDAAAPPGVAALVDRLARLGPDLALVPLDDVPAGGGSSPPGAAAAVAAAHARKLRASVEVATAGQLRAALDAGADAVFSRVPDELDDGLVGRIAERKIAFVPLLAASEAYRAVLARDAGTTDVESACAPSSTRDLPAAVIRQALDRLATLLPPAPADGKGERLNVKRLAGRGALVVAGSGAGDLRVFHGAGLHKEFALMAQAGMTPMQILLSATRDAARLIGRQSEVGQVKEGMAGDLVLLDADPLADIRNARRVAVTIRGGAIYER